MKFSVATPASLLALIASASAFAPQQQATVSKTALAATSDDIWDPLGLYTLGSGEAFDTFPNMFPKEQFLIEAETKHGRMAMLGWTGVWATSEVSSALERQMAVDNKVNCMHRPVAYLVLFYVYYLGWIGTWTSL